MADEIEIVVLATDAASQVFGTISDNMSDMASTALGVAGSALSALGDIAMMVAETAFVALSAAAVTTGAILASSFNEALESQEALAMLDATLRSTAPNVGIFSETIGRLSNESLLELQQELSNAKDRLAEMEDEYPPLRRRTDEQNLAILVQTERIANLTAQLERGAEGITVFTDTTQLSRDQLLELASALQDVTRFSDEEVIAAESMMLRFERVNSTIFPDAIRLSTDLATALGIDLTGAARMIGMALDDPAENIGRLNTQYRIFNDTQLETIQSMARNGDVAGAQALIIQGLTEKFGGLSEAMGLTFQGQWDIFMNNLSDVGELIGDSFLDDVQGLAVIFMSTLLPVLETLGGRIAGLFESFAWGDIVAFIAQNIPVVIGWLEDLADSALDFIESINWSELVQNVLNFKDAILEVWDRFSPGMESFSDFFSGFIEGIMPVVETALPIILNLLRELGSMSLDFIVDAFNDMGQWFSDNEELITRFTGQLIQWGTGFLAVATIVASHVLPVIGELAGFFRDLLRFGLELATGDFSRIGTIFRNLGDAIAEDILDAFVEFMDLSISRFIAPFSGLISSIEDFLGISSPSSVFSEIAINMVLGLIGGWSNAFTVFLNIIEIAVGNILDIFEPILSLFGIEIPGGGASTGARGGTRSLPGEGDLSAQTVNNYYYGPVYFQGAGEPGAYYDCPSPNPFMEAGTGLAGGGRNTLR